MDRGRRRRTYKTDSRPFYTTDSIGACLRMLGEEKGGKATPTFVPYLNGFPLPRFPRPEYFLFGPSPVFYGSGHFLPRERKAEKDNGGSKALLAYLRHTSVF